MVTRSTTIASQLSHLALRLLSHKPWRLGSCFYSYKPSKDYWCKLKVRASLLDVLRSLRNGPQGTNGWRCITMGSRNCSKLTITHYYWIAEERVLSEQSIGSRRDWANMEEHDVIPASSDRCCISKCRWGEILSGIGIAHFPEKARKLIWVHLSLSQHQCMFSGDLVNQNKFTKNWASSLGEL